MKIFFDTSVLVAATVATHPEHSRALPWLKRVHSGTDTGLVAAHSLAELYAILTRLPVQPRISPAVARQLIEQNVLAAREIVALTRCGLSAATDNIRSRLSADGLILPAPPRLPRTRSGRWNPGISPPIRPYSHLEAVQAAALGKSDRDTTNLLRLWAGQARSSGLGIRTSVTVRQ